MAMGLASSPLFSAPILLRRPLNHHHPHLFRAQKNLSVLVLERQSSFSEPLNMYRTVKYEFIADERVRKQTFRKRKAGLLKKDLLLNQMFGLLQMKHPICSKGFENLPSMKQTANMMDQEKFLKKNVTRMSKNLDKEKKKNRGVEIEQQMTKFLFEKNLHDFSDLDYLRDVASLLDEKINLMNDKLENIANEIGSGSRCGKEKQQSI
ncbi:unnamed protein product [Camellia sinensis]